MQGERNFSRRDASSYRRSQLCSTSYSSWLKVLEYMPQPVTFSVFILFFMIFMISQLQYTWCWGCCCHCTGVAPCQGSYRAPTLVNHIFKLHSCVKSNIYAAVLPFLQSLIVLFLFELRPPMHLHRGSDLQVDGATELAAGLSHIQSLKTLVIR